MPGNFLMQRHHKDAPNNWNAVVTGMARDEPTNSNALNVMICPIPNQHLIIRQIANWFQ